MATKFFLALLIFLFGSPVFGQNSDAGIKWNYGMQGTLGMGSMQAKFERVSFTWYQFGVSVVPQFNEKVGLESGMYFSKMGFDLDAEIIPGSGYKLSRVKAHYLEIPVYIHLQPKRNRRKGNINFLYSGGLFFSIPVEEWGYYYIKSIDFTTLQVVTTEEAFNSKSKFPRVYIGFKPGFEYRVKDQLGLQLKLNGVINPTRFYNTDFQYDFFLGFSVGLTN